MSDLFDPSLRTLVVSVSDSEDLVIHARAANKAAAKREMRSLPEGTYHIVSFVSYGHEVRPPLAVHPNVVTPGTPAVHKGAPKAKAKAKPAKGA